MVNHRSPLVSVLMPAYNASQTIRFALASLISQTYQNWECIVVDDGSADQTTDIVRSIFDSRIRLVLLDKNYGRGVARKKSLESARGKYITMLDADDWIYPGKIASQVEFLESNLDVTLHSMAMAIVDGNSLVSVRKPAGLVDRKLDVLHRTFIPHAPSMIRRSDIGDISYDSNFKLAQDQDFLRRVLVGKRYVVCSDVGYSYSEIQSVGIGKIVRGYFYNSRGYLKLVQRFGWKSLIFFMLEISKIPYVLFIYLVRGERYILDARSQTPSVEDVARFSQALKEINITLKCISA